MNAKRFSKLGMRGGLAGLLTFIGSCSSKDDYRQTEKYSLLGHAQFDIDKVPISTTFPSQRLLDLLVDRGICANADDANTWLKKTGLTYGADPKQADFALVSDTYDSYDDSVDDPSVRARLHVETLESLDPKTLFYKSDKPLKNLTLKDALEIADTQKGYHVVPMDLRVPDIQRTSTVSLDDYNLLWERAHSSDARDIDREALVDARNVDAPLNFAPIGSTWIVRSGESNYGAFTIIDRKDIGPYSAEHPFAQDYHKGWNIEVFYKRLSN